MPIGIFSIILIFSFISILLYIQLFSLTLNLIGIEHAPHAFVDFLAGKVKLSSISDLNKILQLRTDTIVQPERAAHGSPLLC